MTAVLFFQTWFRKLNHSALYERKYLRYTNVLLSRGTVSSIQRVLPLVHRWRFNVYNKIFLHIPVGCSPTTYQVVFTRKIHAFPMCHSNKENYTYDS